MDFFVLPSLGDQSVQEALLAVVIVMAAFAAGQLLAKGLGPLITRRWRPLRPNQGRLADLPVTPIIRFGAVLLILVAATALPMKALAAQLILAFATGAAAGLLANRIAKSIGASVAIATALGLFVFSGALVVVLRGLEPLLAGLNAASLAVGSRRVTLLGVLNGLIVIGLLFAGTRLAIRVSARSIDHAGGLDHYQRVLIQKLVAVVFVVVAVLMGIDLLGIDLTALAVFSGAFGLAIGFGLQKTFGNLLSGLILLMDRSIKPGDVIVVGDTFGWVNKIGVRAVSVITRDGKEHLIPNELLMTERVENWSFSSRDVRIRIAISVSYESDPDLIERLMIKAATECPRVLDAPAPMCGFEASESGASNMTSSSGSEIPNRAWEMYSRTSCDGFGTSFRRTESRSRFHGVMFGSRLSRKAIPPVFRRHQHRAAMCCGFSSRMPCRR